MDMNRYVLRIGGKEFKRQGKTYVMGILNVTPDSFYDGGKWNEPDKALYHVEEMIAAGADLVDVGGESTRPGCEPISDDEEIARVVPVIEGIKSRFDIPVSLDTYKSTVAVAGISAGADMINDVRGLKQDPQMAAVIAKSGLPCCIGHCHAGGGYEDLLQDVEVDLAESIQIAEDAGIAGDRMILDPGIGFDKTAAESLKLLNNLEQLNMFGYPILLGCSRKSVIGEILNLPVEERLEGTLATTVMGVIKGCSFVRVHDVKENVRVIRMTEAILASGGGNDFQFF